MALIVAVIGTATDKVLTENVADDLPPVMVTDEGTIAAPLELLRLTTMPPELATPLSVTVPVALVRPTTTMGLTATERRLGGKIVKLQDCDIDPTLPVMIAVDSAATPKVLTLNVAADWPAGI